MVREPPATELVIDMVSGILSPKLLIEPLLAMTIADFTSPPAPIVACTVLGAGLVSAWAAPAAPGRRRKAAPGSIMPVSMTVPQRRVNLGALMAKVLVVGAENAAGSYGRLAGSCGAGRARCLRSRCSAVEKAMATISAAPVNS